MGVNLNDADRAAEELRRAVETGESEKIARAAMANVWPLFSSHADALRAAVAMLPNALLERYPTLRILHPLTPVLARTTRPFTPVMYTEDARSMSPEEHDFVVLTQMIAFRLCGDVPAALLYAKRLEDRILQTRVEARDRLDGPLWYFHFQIGSTLLAAGDSSRALLEFATARQLGSYSLQPDAERLALGRAALAHAVRGAHVDAERALTEARGLPAPTKAHLASSQTTERATAALIAADRMSDDLDDVLAELEPYDAVELTWPFALLARCRAFLARQQPEDALEAISLAGGAHPLQPGSFAADVVAATSIKAHLALGDVARARRCAEQAVSPGVLTRLAMARLALYEGWLDGAADTLRRLSLDQTLGPAQRAEWVLLTGWLELARTDEVGRETALQVSRVARRRDSKRLLGIIPRQLAECVRDHLTGETAQEFEAVAATSFASVEMQVRPALTMGELRVLNALPNHDSTAAMASAFHVSPNTVKSQLRSLYKKLDCSTRDEAIRAAARLHLLAPQPTR